MSVILLLHPGAMGAPVGAQLRSVGAEVLWTPEGRSTATRTRAEAAGLTAADLETGVGAADAVLSICPPAFAEDVAAEVADRGFGGVFVEANAISPERVRRIAERLAAGGATTVDGGIVGGPPRDSGGPRLYVSGPDAAVERVVALFDGSTVGTRVMASKPVGAASALKMAYGGYQKTSRALSALCHALADAHGVDEELVEEGLSLDARPLGEVEYLPSAAARAWRWAPEMREVAEALREAGLPDDLLAASAQTMGFWEDDKDSAPPFAEVLRRLRRS